jgi:hypothetical protein
MCARGMYNRTVGLGAAAARVCCAVKSRLAGPVERQYTESAETMSSRLTMSGLRASTGGLRSIVEETLNALPAAEADRLYNAQRYDRSDARRDIRAAATSATCTPRPPRQTFKIIERYRRGESSTATYFISRTVVNLLSRTQSRDAHGEDSKQWRRRSSPKTLVVDDFLTNEALDNLRRFCWGTTGRNHRR